MIPPFFYRVKLIIWDIQKFLNYCCISIINTHVTPSTICWDPLHNSWWVKNQSLVKITITLKIVIISGYKSTCHDSGHESVHSLRWRHNGLDSVSNHQPPGCLLNRLFRRKSKKTSKLRVTGLCAGNSPGTGEFSAQMASYAENVSIWWRHHVVTWLDKEHDNKRRKISIMSSNIICKWGFLSAIGWILTGRLHTPWHSVLLFCPAVKMKIYGLKKAFT